MGNQEKYQKNNHRLPDGTKNRTGNRHKKLSHLEKNRQLSRDNRSIIRKLILPFYDKHRDSKAFHVLFVEKETKNNERILLETTELDNGMYYADLPIIDADDLKENVIDLKAMIIDKYGISADEIYLDINDKLVIIKGIRENKSSLRSFVLRTYNEVTWFTGSILLQTGECAYYNGDLTDSYFASLEDLGNIVISSDFLCTILNYRLYSGKIKQYFADVGSIHYRDGGSTNFHLVLGNDEVMQKLREEKGELVYLLSGEVPIIGSEPSQKIVQDIERFIRFRPNFEDYRKRLEQAKKDSETLSDYYSQANKILKEEQFVFSKFYGQKRRRR